MDSLLTQILRKCFKEFSAIIEDKVSILSEKESTLFKGSFEQIWKVETELYDEENSKFLIEELNLYIAFTNLFPGVPAKLYLDKESFSKVGYIPHVGYFPNIDICVFDEFCIVDESRPTQSIFDLYEGGKKTLAQGVKKQNESDFEDEFLAYWEQQNEVEDEMFVSPIFSLVNKQPDSTDDLRLKVYQPNQKEMIYNFLLYNKNESLIESYSYYFESINLDTREVPVFYLGELNSIQKPPFTSTISEVNKYIEKKDFQKYKAFINNKEFNDKFVVFLRRVDNKPYYLGWKIPNVDLKKMRKGFRSEKTSRFTFLTSSQLPYHKKNVKRFETNDLTEERLENRTSSDNVKVIKRKFLMAGLGSVGSKLTMCLNDINFPNWTFIDEKPLSPENIGRHELGFKYLFKPKVDGMKQHLLNKLPSQNIDVYKDEALNLYDTVPEVFNRQDYIFLCVGKQSIEKRFINEVQMNKLNKPIFILWVEPYLLGGHCLYIPPNSNVSVLDIYSEVYKFKYSIIDPSEFINKRELFTMKEKGCQSTYSPYSSAHLSLYISSIYSEIFKIIETDCNKSLCITWVGDLGISADLGIKLRNMNFKKYTTVVKEL